MNISRYLITEEESNETFSRVPHPITLGPRPFDLVEANHDRVLLHRNQILFKMINPVQTDTVAVFSGTGLWRNEQYRRPSVISMLSHSLAIHVCFRDRIGRAIDRVARERVSRQFQTVARDVIHLERVPLVPLGPTAFRPVPRQNETIPS